MKRISMKEAFKLLAEGETVWIYNPEIDDKVLEIKINDNDEIVDADGQAYDEMAFTKEDEFYRNKKIINVTLEYTNDIGDTNVIELDSNRLETIKKALNIDFKAVVDMYK